MHVSSKTDGTLNVRKNIMYQLQWPQEVILWYHVDGHGFNLLIYLQRAEANYKTNDLPKLG
jgi:hypothetical protein